VIDNLGMHGRWYSMASIKLQGNSGGSGSVILTAPSTNSTLTITLPDEDMDLGNVGGAGSVKAFASWDGTGTVSLFSSGNVSSVSDNGTGLWAVNFTANMTSTAYVTAMNVGKGDAGGDLNVAAHYRSEVDSTARRTNYVRCCSANKSNYVSFDHGIVDLSLIM
jgi:hypothetical protein